VLQKKHKAGALCFFCTRCDRNVWLSELYKEREYVRSSILNLEHLVVLR
jgi:hypothetical protein